VGKNRLLAIFNPAYYKSRCPNKNGSKRNRRKTMEKKPLNRTDHAVQKMIGMTKKKRLVWATKWPPVPGSYEAKYGKWVISVANSTVSIRAAANIATSVKLTATKEYVLELLHEIDKNAVDIDELIDSILEEEDER